MVLTREQEIFTLLHKEYDGTGSALKFGSVYQLLIAVILSAQTNDNQVNKITEKLFKNYGTPENLAKIKLAELEQLIKTCGLYKNKAKNILAASKIILEQYKGEVPKTREELMLLPGVGRKTANVVLSVGYGIPALAVDTHVFRLAHRLGFSNGKNPEQVEADLCAIIPEKDWAEAHHWLIWHGRKVCTAQKPKCDMCIVQQLCEYKV
ncbi:MAG: endonuclease III [Clostridia bacterium]|jgi:endonuclease-3|nr:endonuclease III [Clostridia bacterium]MDD4571751.1 endonuclease III [Clostridia bacterium]